MLQKSEPQETFEREARRLIEALTEMALVAEELFGMCARALVGRDRALARKVAEGAGIGPAPDDAGETVHARTLALLQGAAAVAGNTRRLLMMQQSATELERIGDHARRIATHALALADGAEGVPTLGRAMGADLLTLIRLVSLQLRGCAELLAAPDDARARRLAASDGGVDRVYLDLVAELQEGMSRAPARALMLTRLLFAAHEMECIGNRVGNICENIRYVATCSAASSSSKGASRAAI